MKRYACAVMLWLVAPVAPAAAAPAFTCDGSGRADFAAVCDDQELVSLDRATDARMKQLLFASDPLTRVLLRRDQRWFREILGGQYVSRFDGPDDPERSRLISALQDRLAMLGRIHQRVPSASPIGEWANALATVTVTGQADQAIAIKMTARVAYAGRDEPVICSLSATARRAANGWHVGSVIETTGAADAESADDGKRTDQPGKASGSIRLRLQANTLRVAYVGAEHAVCGGPDLLTGSYFAAGAAPSRTSATEFVAWTVFPSFDCASARTFDEEEICGDPDLAGNDNETARVYRDTLRRMGPPLAGHLRNDQRAWVKENAVAFDAYLHPSWDKHSALAHQTGAARGELERRQGERLAMLAKLFPVKADAKVGALLERIR